MSKNVTDDGLKCFGNKQKLCNMYSGVLVLRDKNLHCYSCQNKTYFSWLLRPCRPNNPYIGFSWSLTIEFGRDSTEVTTHDKQVISFCKQDEKYITSSKKSVKK